MGMKAAEIHALIGYGPTVKQLIAHQLSRPPYWANPALLLLFALGTLHIEKVSVISCIMHALSAFIVWK